MISMLALNLYSSKFLECLASEIHIPPTDQSRTLRDSPLLSAVIGPPFERGFGNRDFYKDNAQVHKLKSAACLEEIFRDTEHMDYTPFWHDQGVILDFIENHPEHILEESDGTIFPLLQSNKEETETRPYAVVVLRKGNVFTAIVFSREHFKTRLSPKSGYRFVLPKQYNGYASRYVE